MKEITAYQSGDGKFDWVSTTPRCERVVLLVEWLINS